MPKTIMNLLEQDCRYIVDRATHDRGAIYCAEPKRRGSSFCHEHHKLCYVAKPSAWPRSPLSLPVDRIEVKEEPELRVPDLIEGMK